MAFFKIVILQSVVWQFEPLAQNNMQEYCVPCSFLSVYIT